MQSTPFASQRAEFWNRTSSDARSFRSSCSVGLRKITGLQVLLELRVGALPAGLEDLAGEVVGSDTDGGRPVGSGGMEVGRDEAGGVLALRHDGDFSDAVVIHFGGGAAGLPTENPSPAPPSRPSRVESASVPVMTLASASPVSIPMMAMARMRL